MCRPCFCESVAGLSPKFCVVCGKKLTPRSKYTHCDKHVSKDPVYKAKKKQRAAKTWPLYYDKVKGTILASRMVHRTLNTPQAEESRRLKAAHEATRRSIERGIDPAGIQAAFDSGMREHQCAKCGEPGPSEIDHLLPKRWARDCHEVAAVLGQPWAYQPLCAPCNASKGARWIEVYVPTGEIGRE